MQIFIQHNGQQTGPFPLEQVRAGLANGIYQPTDMAWHEGAAGWMPLSQIQGITGGTSPDLPTQGTAKTSTLAVWSLILGILSFLSAGLTAIPAVICGHLALGKIKRSGGTQTGGSLAVAGLVTGYFGFLILGIAMLAGLTAPLIIRQRKKADQVQAISNARQIGLALFEFETEYGSFPNDDTATAVAGNTGTEKISGTSPNARFRQLIPSGVAPSEMIFYARIAGSRIPDGITDGMQALEKGECAFAYVSNAAITPDQKVQPLAMTPFIPGTNRFDPGPFNGKAIILWTDNNVTSLSIDRSSGQVMFKGNNLMDPSHPVWEGKPPVIEWPE